jgi:outer membrane lipoprotein-sorting protein
MTQVTELGPTGAPPAAPGRRRLYRWLIPAGAGVLVAGVAGIVALGPTDKSPSLPTVPSAQLVASASKAHTDTLSGSVTINTDIRIPGLGQSAGTFLGRLNGTRTAEVAADGTQRQRFALTDHGTTYQVVHDGSTLWTYDSGSKAATRSTVPAEWSQEADQRAQALNLSEYQPQEMAQKLLQAFSGHANVKVAGTAKVAGRPAYVLELTPTDRAAAIAVDRVLVSVDSATNVPLRAQVFQNNTGSAAVDIRFTKVSFDRPAASTFAFTPPSGATVKQATPEANAQSFAERLRTGVVGPLAGLNGEGKAERSAR